MAELKPTPGFAARRYLTLWAVALLLLSSGCTSLGPRAVKWERTPYNLAIQETQDTQLLLNLVRLKYRDTPVFLELDSIASQFTFQSSLGNGDSALAEVSDGSVVWKPGLNVTFSNQPTITYAPLQGEKFAQLLLSQLKIENVMLFYRSGWPLKRILNLCVQKLNRVENAVRAAGPTPGRTPKYEDFAGVVELMTGLNQRGYLDLVYETPPKTGETPRIAMHINREALDFPETRQLCKRLGLAPGKIHYPVTYQVVEDPEKGELDHLEVETRSVLGTLFFLSQGVEAPAIDVEAGRVTVTRTETGEVLDWRKVVSQLRIQSSPSRPADAAASVWYRGSWFFIEDTDLSSKSTFALLTQLVALQSGEVTRLAPVLTLPVGR